MKFAISSVLSRYFPRRGNNKNPPFLLVLMFGGGYLTGYSVSSCMFNIKPINPEITAWGLLL